MLVNGVDSGKRSKFLVLRYSSKSAEKITDPRQPHRGCLGSISL